MEILIEKMNKIRSLLIQILAAYNFELKTDYSISPPLRKSTLLTITIENKVMTKEIELSICKCFQKLFQNKIHFSHRREKLFLELQELYDQPLSSVLTLLSLDTVSLYSLHAALELSPVSFAKTEKVQTDPVEHMPIVLETVQETKPIVRSDKKPVQPKFVEQKVISLEQNTIYAFFSALEALARKHKHSFLIQTPIAEILNGNASSLTLEFSTFAGARNFFSLIPTEWKSTFPKKCFLSIAVGYKEMQAYVDSNTSVAEKPRAKVIDMVPRYDDQDFSSKELQVMRLLCLEYSNKEIAQEMEISVRTIEAIRLRLAEKTGSKGTVGIVLYAVLHKIFRQKTRFEKIS